MSARNFKEFFVKDKSKKNVLWGGFISVYKTTSGDFSCLAVLNKCYEDPWAYTNVALFTDIEEVKPISFEGDKCFGYLFAKDKGWLYFFFHCLFYLKILPLRGLREYRTIVFYINDVNFQNGSSIVTDSGVLVDFLLEQLESYIQFSNVRYVLKWYYTEDKEDFDLEGNLNCLPRRIRSIQIIVDKFLSIEFRFLSVMLPGNFDSNSFKSVLGEKFFSNFSSVFLGDLNREGQKTGKLVLRDSYCSLMLLLDLFRLFVKVPVHWCHSFGGAAHSYLVTHYISEKEWKMLCSESFRYRISYSSVDSVWSSVVAPSIPKQSLGWCFSYDINMHGADVLFRCVVPLGEHKTYDLGSGLKHWSLITILRKLYSLYNKGINKCSLGFVEVAEIYPYSKKDITMPLKGFFRRYMSIEEAFLLVNNGYNIRIYSAFLCPLYKESLSFVPFVQDCEKLIIKCDRRGALWYSVFFKGLLRQCTGKFGSSSSRYVRYAVYKDNVGGTQSIYYRFQGKKKILFIRKLKERFKLSNAVLIKAYLEQYSSYLITKKAFEICEWGHSIRCIYRDEFFLNKEIIKELEGTYLLGNLRGQLHCGLDRDNALVNVRVGSSTVSKDYGSVVKESLKKRRVFDRKLVKGTISREKFGNTMVINRYYLDKY